MAKIPRGERIVITILGRRNVGKSSLINAMTKQNISIVSNFAGTTTDPVKKQYELLPIGPVTIIDTAGIDDEGELGKKRIQATKKVLWRTDIAVCVIDETGIDQNIENLITEIKNIPTVVVFNKCDIHEPKDTEIDFCKKNSFKYIKVSANENVNINELKQLLAKTVPKEITEEKMLISDIVHPGYTVVLVVPIDLAAPKGRLILPQVQVLRDILDNDAIGIISKERELEAVFDKLANKPDLVICDSQVVLKVAGDVPEDVPFTTFSTLFARYKGDLQPLYEGASAIDNLKDGDKIIIAEACSHHVQADDIGRVKIPRWMRQYTGLDLHFDVFGGHDFPSNLEEYSLVIHCGGCMLNSAEFRRRILECNRRGVPITNYGISISKLHGVLERIVQPLGIY